MLHTMVSARKRVLTAENSVDLQNSQKRAPWRQSVHGQSRKLISRRPGSLLASSDALLMVARRSHNHTSHYVQPETSNTTHLQLRADSNPGCPFRCRDPEQRPTNQTHMRRVFKSIVLCPFSSTQGTEGRLVAGMIYKVLSPTFKSFTSTESEMNPQP